LGMLVACVGLLATAGSAAAIRPQFVSVRVTPKVLPSSGGEITISVHVLYAHACTLYYEGLGAARTFNCSSGHVMARRHVPANTSTEVEGWYIHVEAY